MRRSDICLYLGPADRAELHALLSNRNTPRKLAWRAGIVLATGGRPGAILDLTWSRVDLEKGLVDLRNAETAGPRKKAARVPVGDDVLEELRAAREISVTRHVIEFCGKPINSASKAFSTAVTKAGLDPQTTPHILRHSAATWMAQAGVDFFEIAGFLGHTSVTMVERVYGHHHPDFMKSAMRAVSLKL